MIDEHRTHTVAHALPLPQKHLGRLVGFFVTDMGPLNQVLHVWACDSLAQREQCRAAMDAAQPGKPLSTSIEAALSSKT